MADPPSPASASDLPTQALTGKDRREYFNCGRENDPPGERHPCTGRTRLIQVAAEIVLRACSIGLRLPGSRPYLDHSRQVAEAVFALRCAGTAETG